MEESLIYKIVVAAFVMPVLLAGFLIWFIVLYQKRKYESLIFQQDQLLREQKLILAQQRALENERNRIASEMHDDLGSGLTTISYLSERLTKSIISEEERSLVQKINLQSKKLVGNMGEIIWAMNTKFDTVENLLIYIRRYASEYFAGIYIQLEWNQNQSLLNYSISGENRRNIFLVLKELFHNIAKHSQASIVNLDLTQLENELIIRLKDNGKGFDLNKNLEKGNGLHNIFKRIEYLGGTGNFSGEPLGTEFVFSIPIHASV
ncbi:MAG: hypothetical protein IPM48_04190 [Saprospiraceae bacterium]|nr:hypothetical protein [Saprospiraceae bacterium]